MNKRLLFLPLFLILSISLLSTSLAQEVSVGVVPSKLDFEIAAGTSYTTQVKVTNNSKSPVSIIGYGGDYTVSQTNDFKFFPAGELDSSNAKWITITPKEFSVPPGGSQTVTLTVSVPANVLFGTHHSAVFFETRLAPTQGENGQMVGQVARVGVAVVSAVGDPALPFSDVLIRKGDVESLKIKVSQKPFIEGLKIQGFSLKELGINWEALTKPEVMAMAVFESTGNTHLNVGSEGTFKSAWFGAPKIDTVQPLTILPGAKREFDYSWDKAPFFGPSNFHGLFIYPTSQSDFNEYEVNRDFWIIPWQPVLIILFLIALSVAFVTTLKRLITRLVKR